MHAISQFKDFEFARKVRHQRAGDDLSRVPGEAVQGAAAGRGIEVGIEAAHDRGASAKAPEVLERFDYPALREQIRRAYLDITGGSFNKRALLSDIRRRLPALDREALDNVLKRMQREEDASLMRLDNQVEITDADHAAALHIGKEPRHILWISR
jgi:hypothetical protein